MNIQDIQEIYSDYEEVLNIISGLTKEVVEFNNSALKSKNDKRIELIEKINL